MAREGTLSTFDGDLPNNFLSSCVSEGQVAWDIETSGLDWRSDGIGTCQVAVGDDIAIVQLLGSGPPAGLVALLENPDVTKVFHHAPFDLRFMAFQWKAKPMSVACTKVASKILDPDLERSEHSLQPVLLRHLGVSISKTEQRSDWTSAVLSSEQLSYAATDVRHLVVLLNQLLRNAGDKGLTDLVEHSFAYLPTRVQLDIRGSGDVFAY
jgi:ribonuclease D